MPRGHGQPLCPRRWEGLKEIIEGLGCDLIYLPPYSPDFNLEQAFSKFRRLLRKDEAKSRESLIEAMSLALSAVSTREVRGFFGHCGYRSMDQPLSHTLQANLQCCTQAPGLWSRFSVGQ